MPSADTPTGTSTGQDAAVVCVDFGSTFTKALLVDLASARVVAAAEHPTTVATDVLDGYDACLASLDSQDPRAATAEVLACSSAGGGLRIAVVGNEELVTAEAGRRVALSSGGKVVAVLSGGLDRERLEQLRASEPDVVLLTGGTDGGNGEVLEHDAGVLADQGWAIPVVVAGNIDSRPVVEAAFARSGTPCVLADNVVPRIGVLCPDGARAAIRGVFLTHVIGGKHLSLREDGATFRTLVRGATPDIVLSGVEVLATVAGDVVVVDVGGATTDVHSVVELDPEDAGLARDVVAPTPLTRTVEGDLGVRWSAPTTVDSADLHELVTAAAARAEDPSYLPATDADRDDDEAIARAAVGLALRRHAGRSSVVVGPGGRVVERSGVDLREVYLVVAAGGVLRHGRPGVADRVLEGTVGTRAAGAGGDGGWQLPEAPAVVVDTDYVLAAVGLLAVSHPDTARRLAASLLESPEDLRVHR